MTKEVNVLEEKTKKMIGEWAARVGRPAEELVKAFDGYFTMYKQQIPGKDDAFYEDVARRKLYLDVKADLVSPAKPYDDIVFGYSTKVDGSAIERQEKQALWNNVQTRAQAVAEGKVYQWDPSKGPRMQITVEGKKIDVSDGTPLDTRAWMIPPTPEKGIRGRKNPRYGKPLAESFFRNVVGFGRPAVGGKLKLIGLMASRDIADLTPPIGKVVRSKLNLRMDRECIYVCNSSSRMKYDPSALPEFEPVSDAKICEILATAPAYDKDTAPNGIAPPLSQLRSWHDANAGDNRRLCVFTGDVTRINRDPTAFGSFLVVIEDTSNLDLEAEGTPVWVPSTLEDQISNFGVGSKVYGIARTTIGPGFNRETGQLDSSIERVQLNAIAIFADPQFRVPPEEESVIEGETVQ